MENGKTWLLVADASKARIYSIYKARIFQAQNPKDLELIGQYLHADSRKKDAELSQDKLGGFGKGTFVEATTPKSHEAETFALELATQLETGRKEVRYKDLILVAPPAFMGLLKKHLPAACQTLLSQTIEKNFTQDNEQTLLKNLITYL